MKTEKDKRMLIREKGGMPFGQKPMDSQAARVRSLTMLWGPHPRSTCPQHRFTNFLIAIST